MEKTIVRTRPPTPPGASEAEVLKADIRRQRDAALAILRKTNAVLGLEEENGHIPNYVSAPTTRARRREIINIANKRSPLCPGVKVKSWPYKFRPTDIPSYAGDADRVSLPCGMTPPEL